MRGLAPFWIETNDKTFRFPDVRLALPEPDGLLAVGGDLSPERLQAAYRHGIFPWYNHDQPILWWAPDPRAVLFPEHLKISRSLQKSLRKGSFTVTTDKAFNEVVEACSKPRSDRENTENNNEPGTWITSEMKQAYQQLHKIGLAHSVECWLDDKLVGGLYGVALGQVFFGESMFTRTTDASKVAFVHLVKQLTLWDFKLIDCQIYSAHLESLGAESIRREQFIQLLDQHCDEPGKPGHWHMADSETLLNF
jgi:leucyl/phenylalanyl-tRNA--protein transferase